MALLPCRRGIFQRLNFGLWARAVSLRALRDADGGSLVVAVGEDGRLHAASARAGERWGNWSALGRRRLALDAGLVFMAGARGERRVLVRGSDGRVWTNVAQDGGWGGWGAVGARRFAVGASLAALGNHESEHQVLVLDVNGRAWTNVAPSAVARWEGWSVLGEGAFPA